MLYRLREKDAIHLFSKYIQHFLRWQMIEADICDTLSKRDDYDHIIQLMETVFQI